MTLLALAVAPGLVICFYIFYKDMYNREPKLNLLVSFIFGALLVVPAALIEQGIIPFFGNNITSTAIVAYVAVAFTEEFCKFIVLRFYSYPKKSFDEPLDGIVYGVIVSMGFATLENIAYVYEHGYGTAILRMFLSVPAHATFGILMGYYVGLAKFNPSKSFSLLLTGIFLATFFHGTFDFFLFLQNVEAIDPYIGDGLLFVGAVISFIIAVRLSKRLIHQHQLLSKNTFTIGNRL